MAVKYIFPQTFYINLMKKHYEEIQNSNKHSSSRRSVNQSYTQYITHTETIEWHRNQISEG